MNSIQDLAKSVESPAQPLNSSELGEKVPRAESPIDAQQIYALVVYYIVLLTGAIALLIYLIMNEGALQPRLLEMVAFLASGALAGSVLYNIRMLFKHYIKHDDFNSKWLGKYISTPWEAVALALAVLSLIQGGGVVLGGEKFNLAEGKSFAAFGLGALVGFGIREVVGWLGNLARNMFPSEHKS